MKKQIQKVIEDLGWRVNSDTSIEMWTDTAGQNYCIECNKGESLKEEIRSRHLGYDVDEEVELFLQAKRGGFQGVPDATILVEDCKEVEQKLEELWDAVQDLPNF